MQIYLNNAAGAFPLASGVIEATLSMLERPPQISGRDVSCGYDILAKCRENFARLFCVNKREIVFTPNATYGLNMCMLGLGLKENDLVITSVMEHNSVLRPLNYLQKTRNICVEYIPLKETELDIEAYESFLQKKPRLVVLTHASNVTGRINPVKEIFKKAKQAGAFTILDACQTMGKIPINPKEIFADMVVFSGYKGLRACTGTGVLYVSKEIEISPVITGGTGVKSEILSQPSEMPLRLEAGTPNTAAIAGLNAALDYYVKKTGEIFEKENKITQRLLSGLVSVEKVSVFDVKNTKNRISVISFTIEDIDSETVGFMLSESFGIECRAGLHCAPLMHKALGVNGTVRFSPSYNNTLDEIDYAINAVRKIAA